MSESRSYGACWTCLLRKTKCDERPIACIRCESLRITCHGYGEKPAWMDGDEKEREEKERIKHLVKNTNHLKRLLRHPKNSTTQSEQDRGSARETNEATFQNALSQIGSPLSPISESEKFNEEKEGGDMTFHESVDHCLLPLSTEPQFGPRFSSRINRNLDDFRAASNTDLRYLQREIPVSVTFDQREASLLMHYLDHIFPLQFPFYKPSVSEGGRGWLLDLILRTRPLFHAVLSLKLCHMHSSQSLENLNKCEPTLLEDIEKHHTLALSELRSHIDGLELLTGSVNVARKIEILACMITFETFRGNVHGWQTHLRAAGSLIQNMKSYFVVPTCASERESRKTGLVTLSKDEFHATASLGPTLSTALDFFTTAFVWFDAISCITTGSRPSCPEWLSCLLLEEDGRLQLCKLMGCKNWAIVIVLKIAALEAWKTECQCNGILNVRELASRAANIEKQLEHELAANTKALSKDWKTRVVTNIFGCSTLTYLHVVRFGACPELPKIRDSVRRTLEAFRALPTSHWTRTLVLPFFITGYMTMPQDERKFKDIASPVSSQGLANFAIATRVVQESWAVRRESKESAFRGVDWKTAMKRLGTDVLMV